MVKSLFVLALMLMVVGPQVRATCPPDEHAGCGNKSPTKADCCGQTAKKSWASTMYNGECLPMCVSDQNMNNSNGTQRPDNWIELYCNACAPGVSTSSTSFAPSASSSTLDATPGALSSTTSRKRSTSSTSTSVLTSTSTSSTSSALDPATAAAIVTTTLAVSSTASTSSALDPTNTAAIVTTTLAVSAPPPAYIAVEAPNGPSSCAGTYALVHSRKVQGEPFWEKLQAVEQDNVVNAARWIHLMRDNKWGIGGDAEYAEDFNTTHAYMYCDRDTGKLATLLASNCVWKRWDSASKRWLEDPQIKIAGLNATPTIRPSDNVGVTDMARSSGASLILLLTGLLFLS